MADQSVGERVGAVKRAVRGDGEVEEKDAGLVSALDDLAAEAGEVDVEVGRMYLAVVAAEPIRAFIPIDFDGADTSTRWTILRPPLLPSFAPVPSAPLPPLAVAAAGVEE